MQRAMHQGLSALQAALDAAPSPVDFFLPDDDAGWADAHLFALLDCTEQAGVPIDLTATEFRILTALLRRKGRVLSPRELVTEVSGSEYADETGYVRRYAWHRRRKIEPDPSHPRYILNERSVGYVFPADP